MIKKKSFTLVELLLAVSIFAILISLGIAAFSNILTWKKRTSVENDLQAAGRHAMEVMANAVEKTDLNFTPTAAGVSPQLFGFYMNNPSQNFYDGPVSGAIQVWVYSQDNTITFWRGSNHLYQAGNGYNSFLTPSNIEVTRLIFDGYQKTSTSYQSSTYQQPYVTISMTLETTTANPAAQYNKTEPPTKTLSATFKTTVRPQAFDNLGYAEIQSGVNSGLSGQRTVIFRPAFSKTPIVIISRSSMNEDDDDTYIGATSRSQFDYSSSISDQSDLLNRKHYWLAVNGNYPDLIKSGNITAVDNCGGSPTNSTCVNYRVSFSAGINPISFVMRDNRVEAVMNSVRENTNVRLVISGEDIYQAVLNWISINPTVNNLTPTGSATPILKVGNSATKAGVLQADGTFDETDATLSCKRCQCTRRTLLPGFPPSWKTEIINLDLYSCAFYFQPTSYFPQAIIHQVIYGTNFGKLPSVLVTLKNNLWDSSYPNATRPQLNTPGVKNIDTQQFTYTNLGNSGNISDTTDKMCPDKSTDCNRIGTLFAPTEGLFTAAGLNTLEGNYSVNWLAASDNFKLTWGYE